MLNDKVGMSVSDLNILIADAIRREPRTRSVTVRGEISGFKHHFASGHWYFAMKDENASISCVMFRQNTVHSEIRPRDGAFVQVSGYVDLYMKNGSVQLYVTSMKADGIGSLYARLEELKQKLSREGLFDPGRKRPLPWIPRKVAVVTSESGAAIQDILNVSALRCPSVPIVLVPVTVQGEGAGLEIARGIRQACGIPDADVIIVARGGGSAEDLWCFNDEAVARAVAAAPIPVVSGVGHETDTTLCDLAADVRASTPSNAAELVFPDRKELFQRFAFCRTNLCRAAADRIQSTELRVARMKERLAAGRPETRIREYLEREAALRDRLIHALRSIAERRSAEVSGARFLLQEAVTRKAEKANTGLSTARARLESISPLRVLNRGYALVYDSERHLLPSAAEARRSSGRMEIQYADGKINVIRSE